MLGADGKPMIFKADKEHQSLTKQANAAWLASMLQKKVETEAGTIPFNEFAAESQLRHKKYEFRFPGRSRAKFLAGKPYEEVSPPKQVVQGKKVQSGDIEITKSDAYLEKRTANRLENIKDEYMKNRDIPNSTPSKPKKTEPTLAERTRVGRKDMA